MLGHWKNIPQELHSLGDLHFFNPFPDYQDLHHMSRVTAPLESCVNTINCIALQSWIPASFCIYFNWYGCVRYSWRVKGIASSSLADMRGGHVPWEISYTLYQGSLTTYGVRKVSPRFALSQEFSVDWWPTQQHSPVFLSRERQHLGRMPQWKGEWQFSKPTVKAEQTQTLSLNHDR